MENEMQHAMESFVAGHRLSPKSYPDLESDAVGPTILIVDDAPMVLKLVASMVKSLGYSPVLASDALHALERLSRCRYDLVITDYEMPFVTGCQLADTIYKRYTGTRVILMSGNDEIDIFEKIQERRAVDGFLHKPFKLAELEEKIKLSLCDNRSTRLMD